ncbi:MAG: GNAT family N-acetyltransferase [Candidatus Latescibacterota bacterium]
MSAKLKILEIHDPEIWDTFVRTSPEGTIFSASAWLDAASEALGGTPVRMGCYRGDELVGGYGLLRIQRMGLRKATTPALTPCGGFLFAPPSANRAPKEEGKRNAIADELIARLEQDFHYTMLRHAPALGDIRAFSWAGWHIDVRYTYVVPLQDMEKTWSNCERRTVYDIAKARKLGITVAESEDFASFLELHHRSFARQKIAPPLARDRMRNFCEQVCARALSRLFVARDASGRPISAVIVVMGFDTAYDWVAGADPDYHATGATSLLIWRILEELSKTHAYFDFSGANLPSISKFKRGFGGELKPYFVTEKYASMTSRTLIQGHLMLKKLTA